MTNSESTATLSKFTLTPASPSPQSWQPREYQKKALKFCLERAVGGLFLSMGLGKSSVTLALIKVLLERKIIRRVLIIAPLRVCWAVWPVEAKKWADFNDLRIEVLHGPKKEDALHRDADIYVINPDGLEWLSLEKRYETLGADMLVVDESSAFKNSNTMRFKLLKYLLPSFRRRYILTGTPAPNGLLDLFGQIYILDGGNALGSYVTHYKSTFFQKAKYRDKYGIERESDYKWEPKPGFDQVIYDLLRPLVLRMDVEDYVELPERIDNTVLVDLPPKARKTYQEIEDTFITWLASGEAITAVSIAAAGVKLRQIANGAVYRDFENRLTAQVRSDEWAPVHDAKIDALEEIVDSRQGNPVMVFYEFEHDATRIRKRFPNAVFMSDHAGKSVEDVVARWNAGEIDMLCAHPASAGHGLNLQENKDAVVWFGLTWNLEHYQQANARVLRSGNTSAHVVIHHIVAKNTLDEAVLRTLAAKDATQGALLDALKSYTGAKTDERP